MSGSAGQNKQHLVTKNTAKLDRETEELHHDRVSLEVGKVIQKGRQEKGLTQKDLATVSIYFSWLEMRFKSDLGSTLCDNVCLEAGASICVHALSVKVNMNVLN